MHYVKKVNGVIVGGPWPLTGDRTSSPNSKWKPEQLVLHGFEIVPDPVIPPSEKTDEQKKEELITTKIRELAITALKVEGELDAEGKVTK
jgi:hypothetical protein